MVTGVQRRSWFTESTSPVERKLESFAGINRRGMEEGASVRVAQHV